MKNIIVLGVVFVFLLASCTPPQVIPTQAPLKETPTILVPLTVDTESVESSSTAPTPTGTVLPTIEFTSSPPAECAVSPVVPQGSTLQESNIPDVSEVDWTYGTKTPQVTILTYCNYLRPGCKALILNLANLQEDYKDTIRIALRHYPQAGEDDLSMLAAQAAEAAGIQNRFWQMNSLLYTEQATWSLFSAEEFTTWVSDEAASLGMNKSQFIADMTGEPVKAKILQMVEGAAPLQISDTPVLFYNGILVKTKVNPESLKVLVDYFLMPEKAYTSCPEMSIDKMKQYRATLKTEKGDIVVELFPEKAPWAVNSFVFLAKQGYFNNSGFFRVVPGFVVQGGDPSNSGLGGPGYTFGNEVDPSLRFDKAGVLAMTNSSANTNGSQFFITYIPLPELDGQYTIFGQVIEGMEVLSSLRPRNPESDEILLAADKLISVTIEE